MLTFQQVPSHTFKHRQSRYHRPRSLPQSEPSPRLVLLSPTTHARTPISEEHIPSPEERLPRVQAAAKERRSPHALGRPRCPDAQLGSDSARTRSQQPQPVRMGQIHAEDHRHCRSEAYERSRISSLGQSGTEENGKDQPIQTSGSQSRSSESIERAQGIRKFSSSFFSPPNLWLQYVCFVPAPLVLICAS